MVLTFVLIMGVFLPATVLASDIGVTIDGTAVVFPDASPQIVDGRTLVPLRAVFEAIGFDVGWDENSRTAILWLSGYVEEGVTAVVTEVVITIGDATFFTNDEEFQLDVPAQIIGGSTMLPIRAVLESVGYYVEWDAATQTVRVASEPFAATTETAAADTPWWQVYALWRGWLDTPFGEWPTMEAVDQFSGADVFAHPFVDGVLIVFSWDDLEPQGLPLSFFMPLEILIGTGEATLEHLQAFFAADGVDFVITEHSDFDMGQMTFEGVDFSFVPDYDGLVRGVNASNVGRFQ